MPDAVKARYLAATVTDVTVTRAVDGLPHRMLRTPLVDLWRTRAGRAPAAGGAHAAAFRRLSGLTWRQMVRDGLAMRHGKELDLEPGAAGREHPDAAQVRDGGRPHRIWA